MILSVVLKQRNYFNDAQSMLKKIIAEKWLTAKAVIGMYPANAVNDDDIEVYIDEKRSKIITTFHTIRQQTKKPAGQANVALADFVKPCRQTGLYMRLSQCQQASA